MLSYNLISDFPTKVMVQICVLSIDSVDEASMVSRPP